MAKHRALALTDLALAELALQDELDELVRLGYLTEDPPGRYALTNGGRDAVAADPENN